jgi:hypothetical protein
MTTNHDLGPVCDATQQGQVQDANEFAEKMAAYRAAKSSHIDRGYIGGLAGSGAIGYGAIQKSLEAQDRERALSTALHIYRDGGDHIVILNAAKEIYDFLHLKD